MSDPNSPNFSPGGLLDRYDNRDYMYDEVGGVNVIPFDWNKGFDIENELANALGIPDFKLKIKDQNGSFSCGGQSWAYYAEVLEALVTKSYEPRSAKYMYAQTCVPEGGSRGRDNADIFVTQGVCRESVLTSYKNGFPPDEAFMQRSIDITDTARQDAKLSMASAYAQTGTDIESIATAIRDNHGVVLGVDGSNNGTWVSEFPKPPVVVEWRHWIYACGAKIINGKKHIKVINSWGIGSGVNGVQWLSADYFIGHVFSGWTHVFAPLVTPTFKHNFSQNIQFNENSNEVKALQQALKIDGDFPDIVPVTGLYGNITRNAVLIFQKKYQVAPMVELVSLDGKLVGTKTRERLNMLFNK